jgi:hypothetical protein
MPYIDDLPVKGPLTCYELPDEGCEAIPENSKSAILYGNISRCVKQEQFQGRKWTCVILVFESPVHQTGKKLKLSQTKLQFGYFVVVVALLCSANRLQLHWFEYLFKVD